MLGYITIGTDDLHSSVAFYDKLLAPLGASCVMRSSRSAFYVGRNKDMLTITLPYNGRPCTAGNGTMIGLSAESPAEVDAIYRIAMESGGIDEGPPGFRVNKVYMAYFRDPHGNKLAVYSFPPYDEFIEISREALRLAESAGNAG